MKLDDFFRAIGPFLEGTQGHDQVVRALWGEAPPPTDARRLAIYGRFCALHRFTAVDSVFASTRAAVLAACGEQGWIALVEDYFRNNRMHHAELNENGLALPEFMLKSNDLSGVAWPAWLPELADLEAWEWRTRVAPDDPQDALQAGPLRLASTVELRPYTHDLVSFLDNAPSTGVSGHDAPACVGVRVLFWRDPDLDPRRENANEDELLVMKVVLNGEPVPGRHAETLADLKRAGVVCGE